MKLPKLLIPGVVLVAALVFALVTFFSDDDAGLVNTAKVDNADVADVDESDPQASAGPAEQGPAADVTAAPTTLPDGPSRARMVPLQVADEAMAMGDPNAPLVMVTFESYGCGWCGHFHMLTMPEAKTNWVDTGLLRIENRMMPYEERALPGAWAGMAASLQGKYWELGEHMYPYITGGNPPRFDGAEPSDAEMDAYHERQSEAGMLTEVASVADSIGLDYDRFVADFNSDEVRNRVSNDTQMGYALGFTGTPAMVINGVPIGGFVSYEQFDQQLQRILDATVDKP